MNTAHSASVVSIIACMIGSVFAEPEFTKGNVASLSSFQFSTAAIAFPPNFKPQDLQVSQEEMKKRAYADISAYIKIAWVEIHAFKSIAPLSINAEDAKALQRWFSQIRWTDNDPDFDKQIGFCAPNTVLVFPDRMNTETFWMLSLWDEVGLFSVAHKCAEGLFQARPDAKHGRMSDVELIKTLRAAAKTQKAAPARK